MELIASTSIGVFGTRVWSPPAALQLLTPLQGIRVSPFGPEGAFANSLWGGEFMGGLRAGLAMIGLCALGAGCDVQTEADAPNAKPAPVAAPAPSRAADADVPFLHGPVATASGQWNMGREGIALAAMVRNVDGMTAVCGVQVQIGRDRYDNNAKVLPNYRFFVGDKMILRGAGFYARSPSLDDMGRTKPNCRKSVTPWNPAYAEGPWSLRLIGTTTF